jgi:hypothetical protein
LERDVARLAAAAGHTVTVRESRSRVDDNPATATPERSGS